MERQINNVEGRKGRAAGALLAVAAALIAGLVAVFALLEPPGGSGAGVDVDPSPRRTAPREPREDPEGLGLSPEGPVPAEDRAEPSTRVDAEPPGRSGEVAPPRRLKIRIVDRYGRPVVGATVLVLEPEGVRYADPIASVDGIAVLEVSGLAAHVLEVAGPESEDAPYAEETVRWTPAPDAVDETIEVVLGRAARIRGQLRCSDGSSPASAGIDIFHVASEEWSNAAAIEDGSFISQWIPAGEVIVYSRNGAWSPDDLREREILILAEGQTYAYLGTVAPAIDLVGTVVDTAGRPVANAPVDVYDEKNPQYSESVLSGEDGRFLCDGLYPGTYLLDLPNAEGTPKTSFTVGRGRKTWDMGNLVSK